MSICIWERYSSQLSSSPSYECTEQPQVVRSSKQHKPTQQTLAIEQPSDDGINAVFTTQRQKVQVVDMRDDERGTDEQGAHGWGEHSAQESLQKQREKVAVEMTIEHLQQED